MRVSLRSVPRAAVAGTLALLVAVAPAGASQLVAPSTTAQSTTAQRAPSTAAAIPDPDEYFGFPIGSDGRLAAFDKMNTYYKLVAGKSDRVTYEKIGDTTLGNPYAMLTISSPKNLKNLDHLMDINARLADPRGLSDAEAKALARKGKPFYYVQAGIHSTEVGNAQAMLEIAHRMATERSTYMDGLLDNAVVLMVPSQNPDGTKLVNDYFTQTAGTNYARVYPDLYQKYTGHDDNRDWIMLTQVESKMMVSIQNKYHPQLFQDAHQAGSGSPRMFTPPYLSPYDPNIDPITVQQTNKAGMAMQRGMTAEGMKGVGWGSTYDYWTPSRQYQVYHGAARLLTEAASVTDLAYPLKCDGPCGDQESDTNFLEPYDSDTWRLRQILDYTTETFFSGLEELANDRYNWLYNFYKVGHKASTRTSPYAYVIPSGQDDPQAVHDTLEIMMTGDVEVRQAEAAFTADGKEYPAGSYVIFMQQPYSGFAKTLLEVQHYPQLLQYPGGPPQQPYDVTAQTLPMLLGFTADAVKDSFSTDTKLLTELKPEPVTMPPPPADGGAYAVGPESYGAFRIVAALQKAEVPTYRVAAEFTDGEQSYPAGTFLVPADDKARQVLETESAKTGIPVHAVAAMPDVAGVQLKQGTRIGLVKPPNNMPAGWLMWMFDQYGVNYEIVKHDDYADLAGKYDALVMPHGVSMNNIVNGLNKDRYPPEWSWAFGVGQEGWTALREYVNGGGTLVAYGSATNTAKSLLDLPLEALTPDDETEFFGPGSLLSQEIDADNPVAWGMNPNNPVWFEEDDFYRITDAEKYESSVVSKYPDSGEQLQSGWLIGGEHLNGAVNSVSWQVGDGYVATFGNQTGFRTWNRGEQKMIFNAMYYGPAEQLPSVGAAAR